MGCWEGDKSFCSQGFPPSRVFLWCGPKTTGSGAANGCFLHARHPVRVWRGDLKVGLVLLDLIPHCAAVSQPSRHGEGSRDKDGKGNVAPCPCWS